MRVPDVCLWCRADDQYYISNYESDGYMDIRNSLGFCRYLENLGIVNGIAGFHVTGAHAQGKVVVPTQEGLAYYHPTGGEKGGWAGIWYAVNLGPGDQFSWWVDEECVVTKIWLHWRLGEGQYETIVLE